MYPEEFTKLQELIAEIEQHDVMLSEPTKNAIDKLKESFQNNAPSEDLFKQSLELLRALDSGKSQSHKGNSASKSNPDLEEREKNAVADFEYRYKRAVAEPREAIQDFITCVSVLARLDSPSTRSYISKMLRERLPEASEKEAEERLGCNSRTVKYVRSLDNMVCKMADALDEVWEEFYGPQTT